jgi:hypothetical protein
MVEQQAAPELANAAKPMQSPDSGAIGRILHSPLDVRFGSFASFLTYLLHVRYPARLGPLIQRLLESKTCRSKDR